MGNIWRHFESNNFICINGVQLHHGAYHQHVTRCLLRMFMYRFLRQLFFTWKPGKDFWIYRVSDSSKHIQAMRLCEHDVNESFWMAARGGWLFFTDKNPYFEQLIDWNSTRPIFDNVNTVFSLCHSDLVKKKFWRLLVKEACKKQWMVVTHGSVTSRSI